MKKMILIIMMTAIALGISLPPKASAADITVGGTTWYTWWDMKTDGNDETNFDPAFLYGPALSVKFNEEFNLSFVFLYGKFDYPDPEPGDTAQISRTDSDLALNYKLNSYLKIFAGGKYMAYKQSGFEHVSYGPGGGISFVLPAGYNFFLLGNISGLYLWGTEKNSNYNTDYNEYGLNSSLSLAYYIVPASVTLSLGGRYQMFKTLYEANENDAIHKFYGITAAATYSFSI